MRRRGFTWLQFLAVLFFVVGGAAVLFPYFARARDNDGPRSCRENLRQVGLAIKQYLSDYDEHFPLIATVNTPTFGWADALHPYVRRTEMYQCYLENGSKEAGVNGSKSGYTDYWYNAHLSGLPERELQWVSSTILLGEGNDGQDLTDARYVKYSLAPDWYSDTTKPSFRHKDGAHYCFADGQVKWMRVSEITTTPPEKENVTFLP